MLLIVNLSKWFQVVTVLITLYKRTGVIDPFYITQCISSLLKEMQNREAQIIDPILVRFDTHSFLVFLNVLGQNELISHLDVTGYNELSIHKGVRSCR